MFYLVLPLVLAGSLGCNTATEATGSTFVTSKRTTPAQPASEAPSKTEGASTRLERTVTLDAHRWTHRPLLVFVPRANEELQRHRARWQAAESGVRERDMWLAEIVGNQVYCEGTPCGEASALRNRFEPEGPVTVVLIGKDGGEKMRGPALGPEEVFRVIDQMPMRRSEMEAKGGR